MNNLEEQLLEMSRIADKQQEEIDRLNEENKKFNKWIETLNKENHRLNNIISIKNDYIVQLHNLIYRIDNPNYQFALNVKQEKYLKYLEELKEGNKDE